MKRVFLVFFVITFLITTSSFAQEIRIEIISTKEKAVLFELEGEKTHRIDSVFSQNGNFQFSLDKNQIGFYRLQFDSKHWIDFINDGKYVEIKTDYNNILDSLIVIKSESNKLYLRFLRLNNAYKTKTELLQLILARYPKEDNEYYQTTQNKLHQIQN